MKNFLLILTFLQLTLISSAQSIVSNEISWFKGIYEKMDFYDEDGSTTISVAPRCYKQEEPKKWVKHIEVNDQSYFINSNGIIGMQTVYNNSGEHIANMDRNGYKIDFVKEGISYTLKPRIRLVIPNILECYSEEGVLVSTTSWQNFKSLD